MFAVAFGNAFDGISLVGPFGTVEEGSAFAESEYDDTNWWVVTMSAPSEGLTSLACIDVSELAEMTGEYQEQ